MSEGRAIKKFVQLVIMDTNRLLLSRFFIQRGISLGFNLEEFTADPSKNIYITSDGLCTSYPTKESRQTINFLFIDNTNSDKLFNFRDCIFPKRLYVKFIKLKNKEELKEIMSRKIIGKEYGFCVFPNESEIINLMNRYEEASRKEISNYCIAHNIDTREKAKVEYIKADIKINDIIKNKIREINIDFTWEKQQQLKDFVKRYLSGDMPEDKLLWLNEQLENTSEILTNKESYLLEKVETGAICNTDNWNIEKTYGEKDTRSAHLVPAYRVYGHYALCCLEFYLDIQKKVPFFTCEECGQLNVKDKRSQKYCNIENSRECFKKQQNKRQRKSYLRNKKRRKINKI